MLDKGDGLRVRVEARKHELLARYRELRASVVHESAAVRDRIRIRFDEVGQHLKNGRDKIVVDVRAKLGKWLERSN